jgi:hypothetical protein
MKGFFLFPGIVSVPVMESLLPFGGDLTIALGIVSLPCHKGVYPSILLSLESMVSVE